MRKILIGVLLLSLTSCQRTCTETKRGFQTSERNYKIELYSGGKAVFVDEFNGIVNNSEKSDGIYYYKNDTLVEVSGDYVIKSN